MNKDIAVALIAILAVLGLTFAINATVTKPPMQESKPFAPDAKTAAAAAVPAKPKDDSPVIMRVNGQPVTEADFRKFVEQIPEQQRAMAASPQGQQMIAENLVRQVVLEQKGREMGLDRDPEVRKQLGELEGQVIAMKALEKLVTPTEQEVRAEYDKILEISTIIIGYQGGQIPPRKGQALPLAQAMQKAGALAARIRGGEDFAKIAQAESDEPQSAQRGGLLGPMSPNDLGPEMGAAIAKLKEGEISGPIRSEYGVHIFRVTRPKGGSYAEMRPMIEQRMKQERAQATIAREMAKAKVERGPAAPAAGQPQSGKSSS